MSKLLISQYHNEVEKIIQYGGSKKETSIRVAFQNLLNSYCQTRDFLLIPELDYQTKSGKTVYPDGTIKDALRLDWGYWESKDQDDNLDQEIENKLAKGYPDDNILFEDSQTAVLIQNRQEVMRVSMSNVDDLDKIINAFINYTRPEVKDFREAIDSFKEDLPTILETLRELINQQDRENQQFVTARNKFLTLCQESINPNINREDIREMMIQHILTEDIFLTIFNESQFHRENNIARELQGVIETFFTGNIKRKTLSSIERYYNVIRRTAANIVNHHEKQRFLKAVYENFYQAYNPLAADRLGIVYTPNEIVKFMIESTDYLVHKHFHRLLADPDVEILDPATGTGTFITELIEYLPNNKLKYKYQNEIHCNEVAILPYYIANLNIEYTYQQKMGEYEEFNNICFVDTLDHTSFHGKQTDLFAISLENTPPNPPDIGGEWDGKSDRKISVIIGNPPYNAKQENFNDNNANRSYRSIDDRIKATYIKEGKAQNQIVLYDMYVRFIRWASDRLNNNGIIAFITNNSFIDALTFDGFRKVLGEEFRHIYLIDLGGNVRQNPKISGTTHNVFGIQAGVTISFLVKTENQHKLPCQVFYIRRPEFETAKEKLDFIAKNKLQALNFTHIIPDKKYNWINQSDNDFDDLLTLIDKDVKGSKSETAIFKLFSRGLITQRDEWVYDFDQDHLIEKIQFLIKIYNQTLQNDDFEDKNMIKWDAELTSYLKRKINKEFNSEQIILSLYRPFNKQYFYFDKHFNGRTYQWFNIYHQDNNNLIIALSGLAHSKPFSVLGLNSICDLGFIETCQCLPLYTYDENGNRIDNITDWGLEQFTEHYNNNTLVVQASSLSQSKNILSQPENKRSQSKNKNNSTKSKNKNKINNRQDACFTDTNTDIDTDTNTGDIITKEDIFYYVYAVLHNPEYRKKYELNLKREFPRIPFYDDFFKWVNWGKQLMNLHLNYETIDPYPLTVVARRNTNTNQSITPHQNLAEAISNSGEIASLRLTSCTGGLNAQNQHLSSKNPPRNDSSNDRIKPKLKADKIKGEIVLDDATILTGIPNIAWEYQLGNRSALEWILDQYKEKKPKDPNIAERFNTYRFADYKEKVIDLLMRVTTVSVETMKIINQMN